MFPYSFLNLVGAAAPYGSGGDPIVAGTHLDGSPARLVKVLPESPAQTWLRFVQYWFDAGDMAVFRCSPSSGDITCSVRTGDVWIKKDTTEYGDRSYINNLCAAAAP